jgi:hypothetical protein
VSVGYGPTPGTVGLEAFRSAPERESPSRTFRQRRVKVPYPWRAVRINLPELVRRNHGLRLAKPNCLMPIRVPSSYYGAAVPLTPVRLL